MAVHRMQGALFFDGGLKDWYPIFGPYAKEKRGCEALALHLFCWLRVRELIFEWCLMEKQEEWQMETAWHKLWQLFLKYKEVVLYLVFGGLTTLVNIVVYAVCARGIGLRTLQANAAALTISILFAYITNKLFVFESRTDTAKEIFREFFSFIACRLGTGALDMLFMFVSVEILGFHDVVMKILSNIIVIVLNYVFSKLIIFTK